LGHSDIIRVINNATWSATGNNLGMSGDMARRTYRIRIDSLTSIPWARTDFLHANLNQWVRKNRGKLLAAFLTFIRAWYVAKCPSPKGTPLGSFVKWFNHVGGVLEFVGVPNFLSNQQASMERYDQHGTEWSRFLLELVRMNVNANVGDNLFTSKDLAGNITADYGTLDEVLPAELADILAYPHSKALTQRVGNILVVEEETRFGPYNLYIKRMEKKHGAAAWCVKSDDPGWLDKALAED